jgi:hypothetical protein
VDSFAALERGGSTSGSESHGFGRSGGGSFNSGVDDDDGDDDDGCGGGVGGVGGGDANSFVQPPPTLPRSTSSEIMSALAAAAADAENNNNNNNNNNNSSSNNNNCSTDTNASSGGEWASCCRVRVGCVLGAAGGCGWLLVVCAAGAVVEFIARCHRDCVRFALVACVVLSRRALAHDRVPSVATAPPNQPPTQRLHAALRRVLAAGSTATSADGPLCHVVVVVVVVVVVGRCVARNADDDDAVATSRFAVAVRLIFFAHF